MRKTVLTIAQNEEDFDLSAEETMAVLEMILWEREATSSSLLSINKLKITTSATCHRILKVLSHKIFYLIFWSQKPNQYFLYRLESLLILFRFRVLFPL